MIHLQIVIVLSEHLDFVDSLKQALAYVNQEGLKFQFLSDFDSLKNYIAQYGQPELLLCDSKLQPADLQLSQSFSIGVLKEEQPINTGEIFIYQTLESFLKEVKKMIDSKSTNVDSTSRSNAVWLLDPCEGNWTKQCFSWLADHHYTQPNKTLCVDASVFGCTVPNLMQIQESSLSEHIAGFLWGKENGITDEQSNFHYVSAVKHPVDLLSVDAAFWDFSLGALAAPYSQTLFYSGLFGEAHLKKIVRHFNKLIIATQENTVSFKQLQQLQIWFNQIEPKLDIKVYHAQNDLATPEQFASQLIQGV